MLLSPRAADRRAILTLDSNFLPDFDREKKAEQPKKNFQKTVRKETTRDWPSRKYGP